MRRMTLKNRKKKTKLGIFFIILGGLILILFISLLMIYHILRLKINTICQSFTAKSPYAIVPYVNSKK